MTKGMIVSLALDSAGIVLIFTMIIPFLNNRRQGNRWYLLSAAALLHFVALGFKLAAVFRHTESHLDRVSSITALIFDSLSVLVFIWFLLADTDGALRFKKRNISISTAMVVSAILPSLIALGLEPLAFHGSILGFSYAISLQLEQNLLLKNIEKNIIVREEKLSIDQAKILTEQMHPHFIFNSLMAIEELCYTEPETAADCIENLSGYLRGNIDALTATDPIPFTTELRHIREYVFLEQQDPERVFEVEYQLETEEFRIPALTVQPIVENAIKHGALTRSDGSGKVVIRTECTGDFIRVIITDNGIGTADKTVKQKEHEGVGLKNVKTRLEAQCGGNLNLDITDHGSRAVILLPKL